MSAEFSYYGVKLMVNHLRNIEVKITNINTKKVIFDDYYTSFEGLFEAYKRAKKDLLEIPELKKLVERS